MFYRINELTSCLYYTPGSELDSSLILSLVLTKRDSALFNFALSENPSSQVK